MSNKNANPSLWWVFDAETDTFSALPTGPFLVPALFICGLVYMGRLLLVRRHTYESIAGSIAKTSYWKRKKRRYDALVDKAVETNNHLDYTERLELISLRRYLCDPNAANKQ